ncbi:phage holin family protein [Geothrix sp. PMB-07]|uniref:phage holin family protein n=1 Tax=Geothrix sp. PMB-07 TaxID=3068640 RepID=UPI0027406BB4|nr:phage holin family protein [Geothrix sp. PMB-07]WLT31064.1 phage holin family protein [Geothrix sp. PMB-07]
MNTVLRFLFSAIGLLVACTFVRGLGHGTFLDLLVVAVILAALNTTLGSLLKLIAFVPMACSFGCFSLVINGLVFWLAGSLSSRLGLNFTVSGFWAGFFGALVSSVVASILGAIFIPKDRQRPQGPAPRIKVVN